MQQPRGRGGLTGNTGRPLAPGRGEGALLSIRSWEPVGASEGAGTAPGEEILFGIMTFSGRGGGGGKEKEERKKLENWS